MVLIRPTWMIIALLVTVTACERPNPEEPDIEFETGESADVMPVIPEDRIVEEGMRVDKLDARLAGIMADEQVSLQDTMHVLLHLSEPIHARLEIELEELGLRVSTAEANIVTAEGSLDAVQRATKHQQVVRIIYSEPRDEAQ